MPWRGLHPIPHQHLYSRESPIIPRTLYSSLDYQQDVEEAAKPAKSPGAASETKDTINKRANKEHRKQKKKKEKDRNKLDDLPKHEQGNKVADNIVTNIISGHQHRKKRKRASEADGETNKLPRTSRASSSFVVGENLVEDIKASMRQHGSPTPQPSVRTPQTPRSIKKDKEKKRKRDKKEKEARSSLDDQPQQEFDTPLAKQSSPCLGEQPLSDAGRANKTARKDFTQNHVFPSPGFEAAVSPKSLSSNSVDASPLFKRGRRPFSSMFTVQPESNKQRETHQEMSVHIFNKRFAELQQAVNFSDETKYLEEYVVWGGNNKADNLPCLGKATGCTAKKEEIIRLGKEEGTHMLNETDMTGGNPKILQQVSTHAQNAADLLMLSVLSRVPVPLGKIDGAWTLYCPQYTENHFDRYGFGQRKLTVSTIAGVGHRNMFTAQLTIPPRTMSFPILTFMTPPHASFRTITAMTASEGYKMDFLFLGNGYLRLRVDLNLLLKGKHSVEAKGKKALMEFIGVHEEAVQWLTTKDEVEKDGEMLTDDKYEE